MSYLGQPVVVNGIACPKIHHAAFDNHLIGIDPDGRVHVSERLLLLHDGPLLEQSLKACVGALIRPPRGTQFGPDRDRLAAGSNSSGAAPSAVPRAINCTPPLRRESGEVTRPRHPVGLERRALPECPALSSARTGSSMCWGTRSARRPSRSRDFSSNLRLGEPLRASPAGEAAPRHPPPHRRTAPALLQASTGQHGHGPLGPAPRQQLPDRATSPEVPRWSAGRGRGSAGAGRPGGRCGACRGSPGATRRSGIRCPAGPTGRSERSCRGP